MSKFQINWPGRLRAGIPILLTIGLMVLSGMGCSRKALKRSAADVSQWVDPLIGTGAEGHTFPGAVVPWGMMQLSPDTRIHQKDDCAGYHYSDSTILGFSHTHYSGTGEGAGGDILLMPTVGKVRLTAGNPGDPKSGYRSAFSHDREVAEPGYYRVFLKDDGITAELTATRRVGLHRYTFPETDSANIILDLRHGIRDRADSLYLKVVNNRKIVGFRSSVGGLRMYQKLYFAAEFSRPFASWGGEVNGISTRERQIAGRDLKAWFRFSAKRSRMILVKVAISKVGGDGALKNLGEIRGWDFDAVRRKARAAWNRELGKIRVEGGTEAQKRIFYTALYHACIHPSLDMDVDGRYRSTNNHIYRAEDFEDYTNFSLWDTFRALHPLYTIINPEKTRDFLRTFVERYAHSGSLPMMEFSGNEVPSMIGYHSISVLADAWVKGIRDFDVQTALRGMKHLANLPWEKITLYKTFGYVPCDYAVQSVSRTLEYSYEDWCLAQVARDLNPDDYRYYSERGQFYRHLFSKERGFMVPRDSQRRWLPDFDPTALSKHYTQGNAWQYTLFVPQDIPGLIRLMDGDRKFEAYLDAYFTTKIPGRVGWIGQYRHGNEPSHHVAYLYDYAGAPWKTQRRVRQILDTQYATGPEGLAGNDDAGQLSAWYVLSALGFYPVAPGTDYYVIGSPLFDKVTINLENGKRFEIIAENNGPNHFYIQSATLNGKPYSRTFLRQGDILAGGKLVFEMGEHPNRHWGTGKANRPPSTKFRAVPMPEIHVAGKTTQPDGSVSFLNQVTVVMTYPDPAASIRYTTNGQPPKATSPVYGRPLVLSQSADLRARAFRPGWEPSYPAPLRLRKLTLLPACSPENPQPGLTYAVHELWLCKCVADIDRYPAVHSGVAPDFAPRHLKLSQKSGVIYNGLIRAPADGIYTFFLFSDDGSVLFVDGELIVDNDGSHRARERRGRVGLKAGFHTISVRHFQVGGRPRMEVKWAGPGIRKQDIPAGVLFH